MNGGNRPTSPVSKFAYSCCPGTFVPYDKNVREQLHTKEHKYLAYMKAFAQREADIARQLAAFVRPNGQVGLAAQHLPWNGNVMNQQLFVARTTDWFFWAQGGGNPADWPVHLGPMK